MTDSGALQNEEREVLNSIYEGDDSFKQISTTTFQYKYGQPDTPKSFLVEIKWGEQYPDELPTINMDTFYNTHVIPELKEKISNLIKDEAEQYLGMSMTYSLFEMIKEKFDELISDQPEQISVSSLCLSEKEPQIQEQESSKKEKKEQLTKAQKRRAWDKVDSKGEKPRGWNWVDIVKHLSQTGSKEDTPVT